MYRVRTVFTGVTGSPWVSTMFFQEGVGTPQDCVDAVGAFWGAIDALMEASVLWTTLADVETVNQVNGEVSAVTATTPVTGAGAAATTGMGTALQGLIRWRTGTYHAGREVRGRTFIPGLNTNQNSDGNVVGAALTVMNNAAAALIADADTTLEIWSREHGVSANVTSGTAWNQFAVLRSRRD